MVNGYSPVTLVEALEIYEKEPTLRPYAGGTDLMVEDKPGDGYLFLNRIAELKNIEQKEDGLHIGSGATFTQAIEDERVPQFLKEALTRIAATAIRNAGTFGGNIGNGSAKADSVLVEYASDADVVLQSVRGKRIVPITDLYLGRKKLAMEPGEIITEIILPKINEDSWYYKKVGGRKALAISRVAFAGILDEKDGKIDKFSAAFGAVADTPLRFPEIEQKVVGLSMDELKDQKNQILDEYEQSMQLTEGRVSANYRKTVCMNLLKDFLESKGA